MKKIFFYLTCVLISLVNSTTVLAQSDEQEEDPYVDDSRQIQYAVKFAPIQMLSGQFNFSFESAVHKRGSLELSVGPTFGAVGFALIDMFGFSNMNMVMGNSQVGVNTSLGYRFYAVKPNNTNLAGLYLSPVFKYNLLRANEDFDSQDGTPYNNFVQNKANLMVFTVQAGYQFVFKSGLLLDMFIGTGFGHRNLRSEHFTTVYNGQNIEEYLYVDVYKDYYVAFTTGLRIGFGAKFKSGK